MLSRLPPSAKTKRGVKIYEETNMVNLGAIPRAHKSPEHGSLDILAAIVAHDLLHGSHTILADRSGRQTISAVKAPIANRSEPNGI
jgi:hypothetical protein